MPDPTPAIARAADALVQYETSGMCHPGQVCDMCDCGMENANREALAEDLARNQDRAGYALSAALDDEDTRRGPGHDLAPGSLARHLWATTLTDCGLTVRDARALAAAVREHLLGENR